MKQKAAPYSELYRGFAPILILLILATLVVGGYLVNKNYCLLKGVPCVQTLPPFGSTPIATTSSVGDWKTYTNSEFGFTFNYAANFVETPAPNGNEFYRNLSDLVSNDKESIKVKVINNVDIYKNVRVVDVAEREVVDSGLAYKTVPSEVNSYAAAVTTITDTPNGANNISIVTIKHPTKNLYVEAIFYGDAFKTYSNRILSTFRFIDTNSKLYENKELGIAFNYPGNLTIDTKSPVKWPELNQWMVKLNFNNGDSINIQNGGPADWPDCREVIETKKIMGNIDFTYTKEKNSKAEYCKGGDDITVWYASAAQNGKSWFISTSSKDPLKQEEIQISFLQILKSFKTIK